MTQVHDNKEKTPPPTFSAPPEREIEEQAADNPHDEDAKVDLGSDESMDASDPPAVTQPGASEPAPSSGYDEAEEKAKAGAP